MNKNKSIETQLGQFKILLWLILAALLGHIGYLATPFGKTQLGAAVGILSLIAAAIILLFIVLRWLASGARILIKMSDDVEAARHEEKKRKVDLK